MAWWRLANSLVQLRREVNAFAPNRSKVRDGTIGDAAHASRSSAHNPNNYGVVCALDITHDPEHGMDVHALARRIAKHPHSNLDYIVSNRQKASRRSGWAWTPYAGSNPHTGHAHFRVGGGPDSEPTPPYDDTAPWGVAPPKPAPPKEDEMTEEQDRLLRELKVSSVARSFDVALIVASINDDPAEALRLAHERGAAVAAKRKELGLDK